jgi:hypothetical protein
MSDRLWNVKDEAGLRVAKRRDKHGRNRNRWRLDAEPRPYRRRRGDSETADTTRTSVRTRIASIVVLADVEAVVRRDECHDVGTLNGKEREPDGQDESHRRSQYHVCSYSRFMLVNRLVGRIELNRGVLDAKALHEFMSEVMQHV